MTSRQFGRRGIPSFVMLGMKVIVKWEFFDHRGGCTNLGSDLCDIMYEWSLRMAVF